MYLTCMSRLKHSFFPTVFSAFFQPCTKRSGGASWHQSECEPALAAPLPSLPLLLQEQVANQIENYTGRYVRFFLCLPFPGPQMQSRKLKQVFEKAKKCQSATTSWFVASFPPQYVKMSFFKKVIIFIISLVLASATPTAVTLI